MRCKKDDASGDPAPRDRNRNSESPLPFFPLATALGSTGEGVDALVQAVADGHAPATLLAPRALKDKLLAFLLAQSAPAK